LPLNLIPAVPEHIDIVAAGARELDIEEIFASSGQSVRECLEFGFANSLYVSAIVSGEEPVALMGVTPYEGFGLPWLIATEKAARFPIQFLKISRHYVITVQEQFPVMLNYVDDRHTKSIHYLKAVGFTVYDPEPYGFLNLPFRRFELCAMQPQ
jgi:hypothetical protein